MERPNGLLKSSEIIKIMEKGADLGVKRIEISSGKVIIAYGGIELPTKSEEAPFGEIDPKPEKELTQEQIELLKEIRLEEAMMEQQFLDPLGFEEAVARGELVDGRREENIEVE